MNIFTKRRFERVKFLFIVMDLAIVSEDSDIALPNKFAGTYDDRDFGAHALHGSST